MTVAQRTSGIPSLQANLDNLAMLRSFVAAVDEKSFAAAAQRLRIAPSSITKHLASLEKSLDGQLIERVGKNFTVTPLGWQLYGYAASILDKVSDAEQSLNSFSREPQGVLKVTLPLGFSEKSVPILSDFLAKYPKIRLDIRITDQTLDLIAEGIDVAVRLSRQLSLGLVAVKLANSPAAICASEDYLSRHGRPETIFDLVNHNCLLVRRLHSGRWPMRGPDDVVYQLAVSGNFAASNGAVLRRALLAGLGIGLIARFQVHRDLEQGSLVELFPGECAATRTIHAVYPQQQNMPLKTRLFIDHLRAVFRQDPTWFT